MSFEFIQPWLALSGEDKRAVFDETAREKGLPAAVIEKDWWVSLTLRILFQKEIAPYLVFKGGTSLSKAWGLIERFSEDIDLALDRGYLGFKRELSKSQVAKLRRVSNAFVRNTFVNDLREAFEVIGISNAEIDIIDTGDPDKDPLEVTVKYPFVTSQLGYIAPRVLIELGSRSESEPSSQRTIKSMVGDVYSDRSFSDQPINISCINPERTLLEKIFLLHEDFQRYPEIMRTERLSRHHYDIFKLSQTTFFEEALTNKELYQSIVKHRSVFSRFRNMDYDRHLPEFIQILPPEAVKAAWENDYKQMLESMIHDEGAPTFAELMQHIEEIQQRINAIE
jgi:hypothetical protein